MDEWSKYQMHYNENGQRKAGREWNSPHMNIITLNAWKGPERLVPYPFTKKPYHVFHMSTFTDICSTPYECEMVLQAFKTRNESKKKADLRFNFIIGGDLNVYEARGFHSQPLLPLHYHSSFVKVAILIGYVGRFDNNTVPQNMWNLGCHFAYYAAKNRFLMTEHKHHRIFDRPPLSSYGNIRQFGDRANAFNAPPESEEEYF